LSSRRLETKTLVSRTTSLVRSQDKSGHVPCNPWTDWLKSWHAWLCRQLNLVRQLSL